jgi:chromosome partitioning protein
MNRTITFANQKGGVGKSTTTLNIGAALAERGKRVLLVDVDPQGSLTIAIGVNPLELRGTLYDVLINPEAPLSAVLIHAKQNIDLVPATLDLAGAEIELLNEISREHVLAGKLKAVHDHYDFVLLDCGPSLALLTINALTAADQVLIPCECTYLAFRGMQLLMKTIRKVQERANPKLRVAGILPTKYDTRKTHAREVVDEMRATYGDLVIDPPIRDRVTLADATIGGKTILEFDGRSDSANEYRAVAEVILNG